MIKNLREGQYVITTQPHRVMKVMGFQGKGKERSVCLEQKLLIGEVPEFYGEPLLSMRLPMATINELGSVRAPTTRANLDKALKVLSKKNTWVLDNWSQRRREFGKDLLSGDILRICAVARDLTLLERRATTTIPSPAEQKLKEQALTAIVSEFSLVRRSSIASARKVVGGALDAATLKGLKKWNKSQPHENRGKGKLTASAPSSKELADRDLVATS